MAFVVVAPMDDQAMTRDLLMENVYSKKIRQRTYLQHQTCPHHSVPFYKDYSMGVEV